MASTEERICFGCKEPIKHEGRTTIEVMDRKYHFDCFCCVQCGKRLNTDGFRLKNVGESAVQPAGRESWRRSGFRAVLPRFVRYPSLSHAPSGRIPVQRLLFGQFLKDMCRMRTTHPRRALCGGSEPVLPQGELSRIVSE